MLTALSARRLCFDNPQLTIIFPSFSAEKPMGECLMLIAVATTARRPGFLANPAERRRQSK